MALNAPTILWAGAITLTLSACELSDLGLAKKPAADDASPTVASAALVERDIEAPEIFQATDKALWDGRPSLGGVWVAAPGVRDPERVIIRNPSNGKSVIGALFKKERVNPGPPLQISSDAAAALGLLAGQPAEIGVTALRRAQVPSTPDEAASTPAPAAAGEAAPTADVTASPLEDQVAASAAAAIESAPTPQPAAVPVPAPKPSSLSKPYVQIGIFSIENNARNTASALTGAGLSPTVLAQESRGKKFWRVIVGPAQSSSERSKMLRAAKGLGFSDAYAVTN